MHIGDVSQKLGMPASTIRYYEKIGLIEPQQRVSGRRKFDVQALFALEFVRLAQTAGFSIAEIKSLLKAYEKDPSAKGPWMVLAEEKRAILKTQIQELKQMDRILNELVSCNCGSLTECIETGIKQKRVINHERN
ncbi:MerR family transcriptional regulator [Parasphingorhabdus halotolerans]|uniref:MerR family transcriptional regulator n=1 Tax=Parasphingorhabdus halotolerans TaxID=2725558 RepID=A0A6H2DK37_9SPHN|nr:MerR family transcriptional regulator [Parasphingorhabdus halotolerans]QJB69039.1 MerR family transcriptional regulator [Parasphingorhabdus halotolerans]